MGTPARPGSRVDGRGLMVDGKKEGLASASSSDPQPSTLDHQPGSAHPPVTWRDEVVSLAPAVVLFVLVSSQTGLSRYFRYVLPCFPFVYVWLGQAGRWLTGARDGCVEGKKEPPHPNPCEVVATRPKLEFLSLPNCRINASGLGRMAKNKAIKVIELSEMAMTDDQLRVFHGNRRITCLDLSKTDVTDAAAMTIGSLINLERLVLTKTKCADGISGGIASCTLRWFLDLSQTVIKDAGMRRLVHLSRLRVLTLDGTQITDEGTEVIRGRNSLETLSIIGT